MKKSIRDIDPTHMKVLVRADFNVPLDQGKVSDDTRIRMTLPTLQHLLEHKALVVCCSHLGRPKGKVDEALRLNPVADRLSELLKTPVKKVDDCVGPEVEQAVEALKPGEVLLLENLRFHPEEKANDQGFAQKLAGLAELYVNDAFAAAHRAHASTEGVAHHLPAVAGLLMEQEIEALKRVLDNPRKPFVVILGGAKISDKIGVIERFLEMGDSILIGGGMANTLMKAKDFEIGQSLVEDESLDQARSLLEKAGEKMLLPDHLVVAEAFDPQARRKTVSVGEVPPEWRIMDIGPNTVRRFTEKLDTAKTVVWNGPLGVTEMSDFAEGTNQIARILARLDAVTIVGGGDSVAAVNQAGVADQMTHVSTGGGAFLNFMEAKTLPGVAVLKDA